MRDTLEAVTVNRENTVKLEEEIAEMQKRVDEAQEALKQMEAKRKQESQVVSDGAITTELETTDSRRPFKVHLRIMTDKI